MGMLEDLLLRVNPGAGFPAIAEPPVDPVDEAAQAEAARAAWAAKMRGAQKRETPFGAPAVPFGALAPGMGLPAEFSQQPAAPSAAPEIAAPPAPQFDGPVPLPRERPKEADGSPTGVMPTDVSSATAQPPAAPPVAPVEAATPAASQAPSGFGSLISRVAKGLGDNSNTLLAIGAGFAGAPNIGQGISRAASAAIPASQADLKNRMTLDSQKQTLQALLAKKIPLADALAAISNPDVMKATVAKYFETKPLQHVMIKDALGNETPATFDQNTGKYKDMAGNEMKGDQSGVGGGSGPGATLLAPGVKFDAALSGDDYLNQFAPEVKAAVKSYMNGDVLPSGNPRAKSIGTFAKTIAQKYGTDMGIPVSDSLFAEKRKYRTELGSTSASTAGGMAKAFNQGIEHADALAKQLEKLGNVDPLGIPSVSRGLNWAREAFSTKQASVAKEAGAIGQTLAGEVGKLFSGAAGGGVHEREATRKRFDTVNSPAELAGALEGTLETMEGGLKALEQRRDQILGPNNNVEFVNKETREKIEKIRGVITRLRSGESAPAAAPSGKTGSGVTWSVVK